MAVTKNLRDGTIKIRDGTTPANEVEIAIDEGDLSFTVHDNVINVLDRGDLSHMRKGDEAPVDLNFSIKFVEFLQSNGNPETLWEAIRNVGACAGWATTNDDGGDVFTIDIELSIASPTSGESTESIVFSKVRGEFEFSEGDEYNTLSFTGTAFVTVPTISKAPWS